MDEKKRVITQVENGIVLVEHDNETLLFHEPNSQLRLELLLFNKKNLSDCLEEGFFSDEQEMEFLKEHGICDGTEDSEIESVVENLRKLKKQQVAFRFRSRELKKIKGAIRLLEEKLEDLAKKRSSISDKTAKHQADVRTKQRLIQKNLRRLDGTPVWNTWEDFENETSVNKTNEIFLKVFYQVAFGDDVLREVAREEPWRSTWRTSCKTGTPIFSLPAAEFTENQKKLVYWSMVYDNVFESLDCPTDDVIKNNELLDLWFEQQHEKS